MTVTSLSGNGSRNGYRASSRTPPLTPATPHSIEAEESTLGAAMLAQHATDWVLANLRSEDFYGRPTARSTTRSPSSPPMAPPVDVTTVGAALGFEQGIDSDRALGLAQGWLDELARDGQEIGLRPADLLDAIRERQRAKASGKVASWGIRALDDITEGLPAGNLVLLAAQTSMGKSSLAIQVAAHNADRGHVLYVTYEMTPADTGKHTFAQVADLDLSEATAFLDADSLRAARDAHNALDLTVYKHYPDAARLLHEVRGLHARRPLSLVVVDDVQKVPAPDGRRYGRASRRSPRSPAAEGAGDPLRRAGAGVRAAQPRRGRPPAEPGGSAREWRAGAQDADFVLFIHKDERAATTADLLLEKNRMGPLAERQLRWHPQQATFGDL